MVAQDYPRGYHQCKQDAEKIDEADGATKRSGKSPVLVAEPVKERLGDLSNRKAEQRKVI